MPFWKFSTQNTIYDITRWQLDVISPVIQCNLNDVIVRIHSHCQCLPSDGLYSLVSESRYLSLIAQLFSKLYNRNAIVWFDSSIYALSHWMEWSISVRQRNSISNEPKIYWGNSSENIQSCSNPHLNHKLEMCLFDLSRFNTFLAYFCVGIGYKVLRASLKIIWYIYGFDFW